MSSSTGARLLQTVASKRCLLTVGTTNFDQLIRLIDQPDNARRLIDGLIQAGYDRLDMQIGGTATYQPKNILDIVQSDYQSKFDVEVHTLVPSLNQMLLDSSFVISHAGAGSILESMRAVKPILVIINSSLMDDHQSELANQLAKDRYIYAAKLDQAINAIIQSINQCDFETNVQSVKQDNQSMPTDWSYKLRVYPAADPSAFAKLVNQEIGLLR